MKRPARDARVLLHLLASAALLGGPLSAQAACTVATTSVAFGSFDTLAATPTDSTGTVTVTCDAATSYSIALTGGGAGSFNRALASGANSLNYNLYIDAAHTIVWGDGTGSTSVASHTGSGATDTVYGRIPARQNVRAGSYADSLVVTITF